MNIKRQNVISWDECFMTLASTIAMRSKDPSTQVGACIINPKDNRIISLGYNGFPFGCSDDNFSWGKDSDDNKYLYVVHAELNAILSSKYDLNGCRIYVTHFPCNECMKAIIQSGIKEIVYLNPYRENSQMSISSIKMATAAGVKITKFADDEPVTLLQLSSSSTKSDISKKTQTDIAAEKECTKIFISLGMNGVEESEVLKKISYVSESLKRYGDVEIVHNYDVQGNEDDGRLFYLGEAIKKLDKCDAIFMCNGWENHLGCLVEHYIAELYKIDIIYEK